MYILPGPGTESLDKQGTLLVSLPSPTHPWARATTHFSFWSLQGVKGGEVGPKRGWQLTWGPFFLGWGWGVSRQ